MARTILVINPGASSTKIACFSDRNLITETVLKRSTSLKEFTGVIDEKDYWKSLIFDFLKTKNINLSDIDYFVARGGLLKPLKKSGTYIINETMVEDLLYSKYGIHASNLGAVIAFEFASSVKKPAYTVDPVVIDELDEIARVSGYCGIDRKSIFHTLNHKAIAKKYALDQGKNYQDLNLIIAHLGSGISVGWHHFGRVVDVNDALGGDGPFSSTRSGGLPSFGLIDLCFSEKKTAREIKDLLIEQGGLTSYLDVNRGREVRKQIAEGDEEARFYMQAMAYQIVKEIGSLYFAAKGQIDAIILTGGLANYDLLVEMIKEYINPIKNIEVYPGEQENEALVEGVLRVLDNQEEVLIYD